MKTILTRLTLLMASIALASCASYPKNDNSKNNYHSDMHKHHAEVMANNGREEGHMSNMGMRTSMMDEMDQGKFAHALDKGVGKATHWTNGRTGMSYTVIPGRMMPINGNPYCRHYTISSMSHGSKHSSMEGTACVSNGVWHSM